MTLVVSCCQHALSFLSHKDPLYTMDPKIEFRKLFNHQYRWTTTSKNNAPSLMLSLQSENILSSLYSRQLPRLPLLPSASLVHQSVPLCPLATQTS
jgi:hypothetical protein